MAHFLEAFFIFWIQAQSLFKVKKGLLRVSLLSGPESFLKKEPGLFQKKGPGRPLPALFLLDLPFGLFLFPFFPRSYSYSARIQVYS
jgi:hypothetical protein